jgi:aminopeptidase
MKPEIVQLADNIMNYSINIKENEKCLILGAEDSKPLMLAIGEECKKKKAFPIYIVSDDELDLMSLKALNESVDYENSIKLMFQHIHKYFDEVDAFVVIRSKNKDNPYEGVLTQVLQQYQREFGQIFARFTSELKWVVFDWPTQLQADKAKMSYKDFYDFVMRVSSMDYSKMNEAAQPLQTLLDNADRVHIKSDETDLRFSIKGINTIIGTAENSYIDGEVYTAPIRDSINGYITYSISSNYMGQTFDKIRFLFKAGKIIEATCLDGSVEMLNQILDTDEGARYIGEFALGINAEVKEPMNDIHYDEKMATSFHLTPGNCYDDAPNGNKSSIHWDLVCDQSPKYGGGEIWFDDVLIKKEGKFVLSELLPLNG